MKQLTGIWWTLHQKQVTGTLIITDENIISLTTYEKLYDTNIINGFAECEKITLVNTVLDRTDAYHKPEEKIEYDGTIIETNDKVEYYTYTYIAEMAILGQNYKKTGDIRIRSLELNYTNLDQWVNWKTETPTVENTSENLILKFKNPPEQTVKLEKFDLAIRKPYLLIQTEYDMQIHNEISLFVQNIRNPYIQSLQEIITCLQFFLILCMGDNINVTKINAIDLHGSNIELTLSYGKSNYENRSIFKNVIRYDTIKDNLKTILKNWIQLYIDNELLIANFVNLQRAKEPLISEYTNLSTAIDNLYLVITKQNSTNDHFAEMVKKLLRETNFILNLSEEEICQISIKVKDIRRYFVHSNKTQKAIVTSNVSLIKNLMNFLIEVIRSRIMLEIGIDKKPLEEYYKNIKQLKDLKFDIIHNINEKDQIENDRIKEGRKIMKPLSKKDKEDIAQLNAIMGTRYRESGYDLENSDDLIEAIQNTTAEYMDYMHYWIAIENVMENFDQSLEVYYPEKWFQTTKAGTTGDQIIDEATSSLYNASHNLYTLASQAEKRCQELWEFLLLGHDEKAKSFFLGDLSNYTKKQLLDALEETTENIFEIDYENQVENDAANFGKEIKMYLENN